MKILLVRTLDHLNPRPQSFWLIFWLHVSPSGYENEAREVIKKYIQNPADNFQIDALGNCHATIEGTDGPTLMIAGHLDELGLIIKHINSKGYLYFDAIE